MVSAKKCRLKIDDDVSTTSRLISSVGRPWNEDAETELRPVRLIWNRINCLKHMFVACHLQFRLSGRSFAKIMCGWFTGLTGFDSRQGQEIFLFPTASRPVLGPTQTPIQWAPGTLSTGVKLSEHEADHSPLSSAEDKNGGAACCLIKHRENCTFTSPFGLTFRICSFCSQICSIWVWQQNDGRLREHWLVSVMETHCVFCEVGTFMFKYYLNEVDGSKGYHSWEGSFELTVLV
jgi:hypothetical protein